MDAAYIENTAVLGCGLVKHLRIWRQPVAKGILELLQDLQDIGVGDQLEACLGGHIRGVVQGEKKRDDVGQVIRVLVTEQDDVHIGGVVARLEQAAQGPLAQVHHDAVGAGLEMIGRRTNGRGAARRSPSPAR